MTDTSKVCVYEDIASGRLHMLSFSPNCPLTVSEALAKDLPAGVTSFELVDENMPKLFDRTFRNAWKFVPGIPATSVVTDMVQARDIQRDNLRIARKPILAALDIEYMQADEAGDSAAKTSIAAEKQLLRDVTQDVRITNATTEATLKAWDLETLGVVPTRHRS